MRLGFSFVAKMGALLFGSGILVSGSLTKSVKGSGETKHSENAKREAATTACEAVPLVSSNTLLVGAVDIVLRAQTQSIRVASLYNSRLVVLVAPNGIKQQRYDLLEVRAGYMPCAALANHDERLKDSV